MVPVVNLRFCIVKPAQVWASSGLSVSWGRNVMTSLMCPSMSPFVVNPFIAQGRAQRPPPHSFAVSWWRQTSKSAVAMEFQSASAGVSVKLWS